MIVVFNQLSGINPIMYFAPRIFEMTGLSLGTALLHSVAIGVTTMIFTIIAMAVINKIGRKILLLVGSVGMVIFLELIAGEFYLQEIGGYNVLLSLVGFIAFFAVSQGGQLSWVFNSEIFPNRMPSKGQSQGLPIGHWLLRDPGHFR